MNKDQIQQLKQLEVYYYMANAVCNPIEFQIRQLALLNKLAEVLLMPMWELENEKEKL